MRGEIRPLLKSFVMLSLPTVAEQILSTLFQYVDTAMVGRLGEEATASVSVTSTIGWLVGSVIYGGGAAILTLTARAYGAKDKKKGEMLSSLSLILSLAFGLLIGGISLILSPRIPVWMGADPMIRAEASRYFTIISLPMVFRAFTAMCGSAVRGAQDTRRPMLISLSTSLLNVLLDYILIYPCGFGVTGAAVATAVCYTVSGLLNLILMLRTPFLKQKGLRRPERRLVRESLEIAFPVIGISFVTCMGYVVFAGMVSGMGTTIFAAHSIAVTAETVFYIPGYGLRTAATALTGAAIGERNGEKFAVYCRIATVLTVGMMVLSGILLYFSANWLMSLFTPSERVVALGAQMLRLVAFSEPFFGLYVVMEGIYYGMGRTRYPFWVEGISIWGVRILFTYLCVRVWKLGLLEVWYCMIADNVVKALLLSVPFLAGRHRGFSLGEEG